MTYPADRKSCPQGHEYNRENTIYKRQDGGVVRVCRICRRDQSREAARRRRARERAARKQT